MIEPSLRAALPLGADATLLSFAARDGGYRKAWGALVGLQADPKRGTRPSYIELVLTKRDPLAFVLLMRQPHDHKDILAAMARHRGQLDSCILWREAFGPAPDSAHDALALLARLPDDATTTRWLNGGLAIQGYLHKHTYSKTCPHPFGGQPRTMTIEKAWRLVLDLPPPKEARKLRKAANQKARGRTKGPEGGDLLRRPHPLSSTEEPS